MQFDLGLVVPSTRTSRKGVQIKRPVRQHHTFGSARTAAGIEKLCDFVLIKRQYVRAIEAAVRQEFFESRVRLRNRSIDRDVPFDARARLSKHVDQGRELTFKDQHPCPGVIENPDELRGRETNVERHHNRMHHRRPVVAFEKLAVVEA